MLDLCAPAAHSPPRCRLPRPRRPPSLAPLPLKASPGSLAGSLAPELRAGCCVLVSRSAEGCSSVTSATHLDRHRRSILAFVTQYVQKTSGEPQARPAPGLGPPPRPASSQGNCRDPTRLLDRPGQVFGKWLPVGEVAECCNVDLSVVSRHSVSARPRRGVLEACRSRGRTVYLPAALTCADRSASSPTRARGARRHLHQREARHGQCC